MPIKFTRQAALIVLTIALLNSTACSESDRGDDSSATTPLLPEGSAQVVERTPLQSSTTAATTKIEFPVARVAPYISSVNSWSELLRSLPKEEAAYLEDIESRYFSAVAFDSQEERKLLERLEFPLPEEWLAAKNMSDQELKNLSDSGTPKASAIYLDRLISRSLGKV